jgi:hypothetical protein
MTRMAGEAAYATKMAVSQCNTREGIYCNSLHATGNPSPVSTLMNGAHDSTPRFCGLLDARQVRFCGPCKNSETDIIVTSEGLMGEMT